MVNSYLNVILFLLTTFFYYITLKPTPSRAMYSNKLEYKSYISVSYMYLAIYVVLVLCIQCLVNSSLIASKCGGSIINNMNTSCQITCMPWILIFGVLVGVIVFFPGFKSAFSDVIGYYYVSNSASKLLTELFMDTNQEHQSLEDSDEKRASDVIVKICGNTSTLINQIVPSNFEQYWSILTPLMKDKYKYESPETDKMKSDLFNLSLTRDNIGEAVWYIYTGLLLILIVQFKITNRGCSGNPKTMEAKHQN